MTLSEICNAIEYDYDTKRSRSQARCPGKWAIVMKAILELPVPTYEEPKPVSGEINSNAS